VQVKYRFQIGSIAPGRDDIQLRNVPGGNDYDFGCFVESKCASVPENP